MFFDDFDAKSTFTIYNLQGVAIKTGALTQQINVSDLPAGVYIFLQEDKDSFWWQRFVKIN